MTDDHKPAGDAPAAQPPPEPPPSPAEPPAEVPPEPVLESPPEAVPPELRPEPERLLLHMPVDVRSASLVVLAVLAAVFALRWGQAVFIPLMLSLLLTYALSPLVDRLHRLRLPRWIGAALILVGLFGGVGWKIGRAHV